jgi:hypothetical protein
MKDKKLELPDQLIIRQASTINILLSRNLFLKIKNQFNKITTFLSEKMWILFFLIYYYSVKFRILLVNENRLIKDLQSHEKTASEAILITIPVRKLGNRNCYFDKFLEEFITFTEFPKTVLLYVAIDQDDDLFFFKKLKTKYQRLINIRFFIGPKNSGYQGTLGLHLDMLQKRPDNFAVWILGSSDMKPVMQHWDSKLLRCINQNDQPAFIGGGPIERLNKIHGPNPAGPKPIYWVGTDDYPIVSKPMIDYLDSLTDTRGEETFSVLGDTWHIDGHFGEILRHLSQLGRPDFFISIPHIFEERFPGGWNGNPNREAVRNKVLSEFFEPNKQKIYRELAKNISSNFSAVDEQS